MPYPYSLRKQESLAGTGKITKVAGVLLQRGTRKKTGEATREFLRVSKNIDAEFKCPCCKSLFYFPSSDHIPLETVPCPEGCKDSYVAYWEDDFPEEIKPIW